MLEKGVMAILLTSFSVFPLMNKIVFTICIYLPLVHFPNDSFFFAFGPIIKLTILYTNSVSIYYIIQWILFKMFMVLFITGGGKIIRARGSGLPQGSRIFQTQQDWYSYDFVETVTTHSICTGSNQTKSHTKKEK